MSIFGMFQRNNKAPDPETGKVVAEQLYKRNQELAIKNKTLSLLQKLYDISILTLEPQPLAEQVTNAIESNLGFELVGLFRINEEKNTLETLHVATSERFSKALNTSVININWDQDQINYAHAFFDPIIKKHQLSYIEGMPVIWNSLDVNVTSTIAQESHVRSTIAYPLIVEGKIIAILILCLNREYSKLIEYEKDSISSFINVITTALDKALLYQQLKITNSKLEDANSRLKELDQLKTEFISLATHQIRAPLTAIKGYISLIREGDYGDVSKEVDSALGVVSESTNNLVTIVGDFLDVSRIEQNRMKYDFTDFNVSDLVQQVITEYKPNVDRRGLALHFTRDQNDESFVHADHGKLKQIFGNILDNSIKYTQQGSIDVSVTKKDDRILIKVADTGVGIPQNTIPKLFQKFTRASNANEANILGTGLGLYVAKQMIEAHQGRIWAESEGPGKGSQFYIELKAMDKSHILSGHLSIPPASSII